MAAPPTPLALVLRFSTAHPDVLLAVPHPHTTTGLALKQLLRARLDAPAATSRLRLIHAGKVLPDAAALAGSLHVAPPPPPRDAAPASAKAQGKQPVRDTPAAPSRVYIHCALGDALTPAELAAEAQEAEAADEALLDATAIATLTTTDNASPTTTPAPRGFDRLLHAGFTAPEIATLRTQFRAIQSHSHTPDTMPSGAALLALEERWLDASSPAGGGAEAAGGGGALEAEDAGGLEDMLYGNLIGFFWPVGALGWLMREQGVWSRRKQIAVLSGFLVNLTFGGLRFMA
ncbi:hypothetical protein LTR08_000900 [Meristemomyces frigidus]|nr:hypothetical protein LTR08_000900 [Meristemomyces frigidus]